MIIPQPFQGIAPCRLARLFDGRPIALVWIINAFTFKASTHYAVPGGEVRNDLPDAVRVNERPGSSLDGCGWETLRSLEK